MKMKRIIYLFKVILVAVAAPNRNLSVWTAVSLSLCRDINMIRYGMASSYELLKYQKRETGEIHA